MPDPELARAFERLAAALGGSRAARSRAIRDAAELGLTSTSATLRELGRFVGTRRQVLDGGTASLLQAAYALGESSPIGRVARRWLEDNHPGPWLRLLDAPAVAERDALLSRYSAPAWPWELSPDGRVLYGLATQHAIAWDVLTAKLIARKKLPAAPTRAALTLDGRTLLIADKRGALLAWDLEADQLREAPLASDGSIEYLAVTPDGRRAITARLNWRFEVWDLATLEPLVRARSSDLSYGDMILRWRSSRHPFDDIVIGRGLGERGAQFGVASAHTGDVVRYVDDARLRSFFPTADGARLVVWHHRWTDERAIIQHLRIYSLPAFEPLRDVEIGPFDTFRRPLDRVARELVGLSPDDRWATVDRGDEIVLHALDGERRLHVSGARAPVAWLTPTRFVARTTNSSLAIFDLDDAHDDTVARPRALLASNLYASAVWLGPENRVVIHVDNGGLVGTYDIAVGELSAAVDARETAAPSIASLSCDATGPVALIDGREVARFADGEPVSRARISERFQALLAPIPGGDRYFCDHPVRVVDATEPTRVLVSFPAHANTQLETAAFDAAGRRAIVTWDDGRAAEVFELTDGRSLGQLHAGGTSGEGISAAVLTADGEHAILGTTRGRLVHVPAGGGKPVRIGKHTGEILGLCITAAGVVVSVDQTTLTTWTLAPAKKCAAIKHGVGRPVRLALDSARACVALAGERLAVEVFAVPDLHRIARLDLAVDIRDVTFAPTGELVVATGAGRVERWRFEPER